MIVPLPEYPLQVKPTLARRLILASFRLSLSNGKAAGMLPACSDLGQQTVGEYPLGDLVIKFST